MFFVVKEKGPTLMRCLFQIVSYRKIAKLTLSIYCALHLLWIGQTGYADNNIQSLGSYVLLACFNTYKVIIREEYT